MYSNFRFVGIHIWNYILDHLDINVTLPKFLKKHLKHIFWLIILHIMLSSQLSMFSYLFIKYQFLYHLFITHFCLTLYIIYSLLYCTYQSNLLTLFNPLVPGLFSLKSAYRPEAYFGKLMYEGHIFLEMLLFCNPLTYNAV